MERTLDLELILVSVSLHRLHGTSDHKYKIIKYFIQLKLINGQSLSEILCNPIHTH